MTECIPWLKNHYRYSIILITFLMLGSLMICTDVFTFTMIIMETNSTTVRVYSTQEKNFLISSLAIGTLLGTYPFDILYTKYGARYIQFIAGMICAVTTALFPYIADRSFPGAAILRMIQGFSFASDYPTVGLVTSQWAPISEIGVFLSIISSFTVMKSFVEIPLAGWITQFADWRAIYYVLSAFLFIISFLWLLIYRDQPDKYEKISKQELYEIQKNKTDKHNDMQIKVPIKAVCTNKYILAIWIVAFTDTFASFCLLVYATTYFAFIGMSTTQYSMATAVGGYAFLFFKVIGGIISDRVKCISETNKIRIFHFLSAQMPAIVLLPILFVDRNNWTIQVIILTSFLAFAGLNVGSFYRGAALISREYSHFVIGTIQVFKSVSLLLIPQLYNLILWIDEDHVWEYFFSVIMVVLTIGHFGYFFYIHTDRINFDGVEDKNID